MFWRRKADRDELVTAGPPVRQVLRCSFCNKLQDDVPKLIAGPKVFICDECVAVCNDILAADARFEKQSGKKAREPKAERATAWPKSIQCGLCANPISAGDGVVLGGNRGTLCPDCVTAVQAASGATG